MRKGILANRIKQSIRLYTGIIIIAILIFFSAIYANAGIHVKCKSVKLGTTKAVIAVGDVVELSAIMNPVNSTERLKWKSSNKDVASVTQTGCVTAIAPGTARIMVKTSSRKKAYAEIQVKEYLSKDEAEELVRNNSLSESDISKIVDDRIPDVEALQNKLSELEKQVDSLNEGYKTMSELEKQVDSLNEGYKTMSGSPTKDEIERMIEAQLSEKYNVSENNVPFPDSVLNGKKVICFGDSITYGQSRYEPSVSDAPWPRVLAMQTGADVVNMGICGSTLAYVNSNETSDVNRDSMVYLIDRLDVSEYDYIFIAFGTNDLSYKVPIGENNDEDTHTFKGAANYVINRIHEQNENAKIIFVTPMLDSRRDTSYCDATVEVADYNGVDCIDMRNLGITEDDLYDLYFDHSNPMHPTESTYYVMGVYISKYPECENHKCYKIIYDSQGGTMDMRKSLAVRGDKITHLLITVRQGYDFCGWYTEKEGGELVTEDSIYSFDHDVTLYAHFYPH